MRNHLFLTALCLLLSSCTQASMPEAGSATSSQKEENGIQKEGVPAIPAALSKESLEGKWFLSMYQDTVKLPVALVDISKAEGDGYQVTVSEIHPQFPPSKLKSASVKDDKINIVFDSGDADYVYEGKLGEEGFKGTGTFELRGGSCYPALMVSTELDSFEGIRGAALPNRDLYVTAVTSSEPVANLEKIVTDLPNDPLALHAGLKLIEIAKKYNLDQETVEKLITSYVKNSDSWGSKLGIMARINSAFALLNTQNYPRLALKVSEETQSMMDEKSKEYWGHMVESSIKTAGNAITLDDAMNGKGDVQEKAIAKLRELIKTDPFDPELLATLASYEQSKGNLEDAKLYYAMIVAFPQMEQMYKQIKSDASTSSPSAMDELMDLWKKTNNDSTDGLDEYINKVYHDYITMFVDGTYPPRKPEPGDRRILLEFFTGAMCPPCAAADVALAGINKKYAESEVIILTYHQHIPGPDPMANAQSEARFPYYPSRGTPSVYLNGKQLSGVASSMYRAVPIYHSMQNLFEPELNNKNGITLDLKADAKDGNLDITAEVNGLKDVSDSLKLRLAIAETEINLPVSNGVREHHMTVRYMPGGVEGISPENGGLKFSESISLGELKEGIVKYLKNYAESLNFSFAEVPLEFKNLQLVAFVQDDKTKEVLQVKAIPVQGKLIFKPVPEKSADSDSKEEPSEKESDSKEAEK